MNNKQLYIEQTLHGYSHGHHLLAASIQLSKTSQRNMLYLSDLSGPDISSGFTEYLTGYPLSSDGYYALAKTWYAPEMERPGCVWTHTLLIKFDILNKIENVMPLLSLFKRPDKTFKIEDYCNPIDSSYVFDNMNNINFNNLNINNIIANKLKYLLSSVYNEENPVILPSESSDEYQESILLLWKNQWLGLQKDFTFCTGSLSNRKLEKKIFDIQIVPYSLSKSIGRSEKEIKVIDTDQIDSSTLDYPEWVLILVNDILYTKNKDITEFINDFGVVFKGKNFFKKLVQLFIELKAKNSIKSINEFISVTRNIFIKENSNLLINHTVNSLFTTFPNRWFGYKDFSLFLQDLSIVNDISNIELENSQLKIKLMSLWESNRESAKKLFKGLISKDLNKFGEILLKEFSIIILPEQLPLLTDMDLGACNVLVGLQPEFAICQEIWYQSKDFQNEIINCLNQELINESLANRILEGILENSSEVLYKQIFDSFGEKSIEIFLNWCKKSDLKSEKVSDWFNICKYSPSTCLKWIFSNQSLNVKLLVSIISVLDPYSEEVLHEGIKPWLLVFKELDSRGINTDLKMILSQFILPLVLMSKEAVPNSFAEFVFKPVHDQLAKNQFNYEQWIKLESILPDVPWYSSWDKCKRLRKAMMEKGYSIQSYEYL